MDADQFDLLTRTLASTRSRRAVSQTLAGLSVAGGLTWLADTRDVLANKHKKKRKKRRKCRNRCDGCQKCVRGKCKRRPDGWPCLPGRTCQAGDCLCLPGTYFCGDSKVETCCTSPQACYGHTCGECPATDAVYCDLDQFITCGLSSLGTGLCQCVVSVEGTVACTPGRKDCGNEGVGCTTDAECVTALGAPSVCVLVDGDECAPCSQQGETVCVLSGCP